jgi:hypothetical protein
VFAAEKKKKSKEPLCDIEAPAATVKTTTTSTFRQQQQQLDTNTNTTTTNNNNNSSNSNNNNIHVSTLIGERSRHNRARVSTRRNVAACPKQEQKTRKTERLCF